MDHFVTVRRGGQTITTTHYGPMTRAEAIEFARQNNADLNVIASVERLQQVFKRRVGRHPGPWLTLDAIEGSSGEFFGNSLDKA
jgi:hypothetical protein